MCTQFEIVPNLKKHCVGADYRQKLSQDCDGYGIKIVYSYQYVSYVIFADQLRSKRSCWIVHMCN